MWSTRLTTSRDEYDLPVKPHVYGSRESACATRPYFSLSMNSLIGMLSGIGGNTPADWAGRNTIVQSQSDVTGEIDGSRMYRGRSVGCEDAISGC